MTCAGSISSHQFNSEAVCTWTLKNKYAHAGIKDITDSIQIVGVTTGSQNLIAMAADLQGCKMDSRAEQRRARQQVGEPASSQVVQRVRPRGREPLVVLEPAATAGLPEPPRAVQGGEGALGPPPAPRLAVPPSGHQTSRDARTDGGSGSGCSIAGASAPPDRGLPVVRRRRHAGPAEEQRGRPERQRDQRDQQQELDAPGAHIFWFWRAPGGLGQSRARPVTRRALSAGRRGDNGSRLRAREGCRSGRAPVSGEERRAVIGNDAGWGPTRRERRSETGREEETRRATRLDAGAGRERRGAARRVMGSLHPPLALACCLWRRLSASLSACLSVSVSSERLRPRRGAML